MRTLMMMTAVVYAVGSYSFGGATMAQGRSAGAAKSVALVHGAFADDSSWSKVVPLLKAKGLRVTTAGNPLGNTDLATSRWGGARCAANQCGRNMRVSSETRSGAIGHTGQCDGFPIGSWFAYLSPLCASHGVTLLPMTRGTLRSHHATAVAP